MWTCLSRAKAEQESGLDCLICAIFSQQRMTVSLQTDASLLVTVSLSTKIFLPNKIFLSKKICLSMKVFILTEVSLIAFFWQTCPYSQRSASITNVSLVTTVGPSGAGCWDLGEKRRGPGLVHHRWHRRRLISRRGAILYEKRIMLKSF